MSYRQDVAKVVIKVLINKQLRIEVKYSRTPPSYNLLRLQIDYQSNTRNIPFD